MYIHLKRKNLKRKSTKSYPQRRENKRELLKASNETQQPQKKERKSATSCPRRCEHKRELLKAPNETQKPQTKSDLGFSTAGIPARQGGNPILFLFLFCDPILQSSIITEKNQNDPQEKPGGGGDPHPKINQRRPYTWIADESRAIVRDMRDTVGSCMTS